MAVTHYFSFCLFFFPFLFPASLAAETLLFPTASPLSATALEKDRFGFGVVWSGLASGYAQQWGGYGHYGITEDFDLSLSLFPDFSEKAAGLGMETFYTAFTPGNWLFGGYFGGYHTLGKTRTYHFEHGDVDHHLLSLRLGILAQWKWIYFGMGAIYLENTRDYQDKTRPYAKDYGQYDVGSAQQFLGLHFGEQLKFHTEVAAMDERLYSVFTQPSEPWYAAGFTLAAGLTYFPAAKKGQSKGANLGEAKPLLKHSGPRVPGLASSPKTKPLFHIPQYWRGVGFGAMAAGLGAVLGAAYGSTLPDKEAAFFPPEFLLGVMGAVISIPLGSTYGVFSYPPGKSENRSLPWTLAGTAAGFGAGILLAPISGGMSLFFLTPLGSAMGYQYARNKAD